MKLCAYCGQKNPDEVVACSSCGTTEFEEGASPVKPARLSKSDREWNSHDAWKCALVVIGCSTIIALWAGGAKYYAKSHDRAAASFAIELTQAVVWLYLGYWFSRCRSFRTYLTKAGVPQRPTLLGWFAALVILGLGLIQQYSKQRGWVIPITHVSFSRPELPSLLTLIIGPIYEEILTRGFLYRAFRGSYGAVLSTALVICFSAVFHISIISRSVVPAVTFIVGGVVFCVVRERSISIWNCVLGHAVFNAAMGHDYWLCLAEMVVFLPFCRFSKSGLWNETQMPSPVNQHMEPTPR